MRVGSLSQRLILDLAETATLFGVSEKTLRAWAKSGGMPVVTVGTQGGARKKTRLDLLQVVGWYFARNPERRELDRVRARLTAANAELAELRAGASRGDLVSLRTVGAAFGEFLSVMRTNISALPARLAPELAASTTQPERFAVIETATNELLDYLSSWRPGERSD
jgi:phage terminase Nu1 subunit (DNA packaging protein)